MIEQNGSKEEPMVNSRDRKFSMETNRIDKLTLKDIKVKDKGKLFRMHFRAMFAKRYYHFSRARSELFFEIVIPILLMFIGIVFSNVTWVVPSPNADLTDYGYYPTPQNVMIN